MNVKSLCHVANQYIIQGEKKMRTTDVEYKRMALAERIKKLEENPKDIKCSGVLKALRRELRNLG